MPKLLLTIGIFLGISFLCSMLEAVLLSMSHSYVAVLQERGAWAPPRREEMR